MPDIAINTACFISTIALGISASGIVTVLISALHLRNKSSRSVAAISATRPVSVLHSYGLEVTLFK